MTLNKKAFTILEMGVVIICISIFMKMTMKSVSLTNIAKEFSTRLKLRKIDIALENYVKIHGHLPCPSDIKLRIDDPNFGVELSTDNGGCQEVDGLFKYKEIYVGGVPTRALELNHKDAIDLWGNKIIYSVDDEVVDEYINTSTNLCVVFVGANNKTSKINNLYYALISNGKNKFGAIPSRSSENIKINDILHHKYEVSNIFSKSEFLGGYSNCLVGISKNNKNFDDIVLFSTYNSLLIKKINRN